MTRPKPGPRAPFQLFKSVGVLEPIAHPSFRSLPSALDWAQRWVRNGGCKFGLVAKRGYIIQFRVAADGFVSLGENMSRSKAQPNLPGLARALPGPVGKVQCG